MSAQDSFAKKQLRITLALSNNAVFQGTNSNTLVLSGLRASASLKSNGFPAFPNAEIKIYGMLQSDMNALSALATNVNGFKRNTIIVEANSGNGYSIAFAGQIVTAMPDYTGAPDVFFRVTAQTLFFEALNPTDPASYTGPTDVATIVQNIAAKMGYAFENNGVDQQLDSPYFANTLAEQLRAVADAAGIDVYCDGQVGPLGAANLGEPGTLSGNVIAICPRGEPRNTPVWVLTKDTGLVGYPMRDSNGYIRMRVLYNPAFRFGGLVDLQNSGIANIANQQVFDVNDGAWLLSTITHTLESEKPGGSWYSDLLAYPRGRPLGAQAQ